MLLHRNDAACTTDAAAPRRRAALPWHRPGGAGDPGRPAAELTPPPAAAEHPLCNNRSRSGASSGAYSHAGAAAQIPALPSAAGTGHWKGFECPNMRPKNNKNSEHSATGLPPRGPSCSPVLLAAARKQAQGAPCPARAGGGCTPPHLPHRHARGQEHRGTTGDHPLRPPLNTRTHTKTHADTHRHTCTHTLTGAQPHTQTRTHTSNARCHASTCRGPLHRFRAAGTGVDIAGGPALPWQHRPERKLPGPSHVTRHTSRGGLTRSGAGLRRR
jgi:hypothetical protein